MDHPDDTCRIQRYIKRPGGVLTGTSILTLPAPAQSTMLSAGAQFKPVQHSSRTEFPSPPQNHPAESPVVGKQVELTETIVERRVLISEFPPPPAGQSVSPPAPAPAPAANVASMAARAYHHSTIGYTAGLNSPQLPTAHLQHKARTAYAAAGSTTTTMKSGKLDLMA